MKASPWGLLRSPSIHPTFFSDSIHTSSFPPLSLVSPDKRLTPADVSLRLCAICPFPPGSVSHLHAFGVWLILLLLFLPVLVAWRRRGVIVVGIHGPFVDVAETEGKMVSHTANHSDTQCSLTSQTSQNYCRPWSRGSFTWKEEEKSW